MCYIGDMDGLLPLPRGRTAGKEILIIHLHRLSCSSQLSLCLRNSSPHNADVLDEHKDDLNEKTHADSVTEVAI